MAEGRVEYQTKFGSPVTVLFYPEKSAKQKEEFQTGSQTRAKPLGLGQQPGSQRPAWPLWAQCLSLSGNHSNRAAAVSQLPTQHFADSLLSLGK